jgi:hypothetical protein
MFKEMTPKKKYIIIGVIVLVVIVIVVLIVRSRKKKKAELLSGNNSNYGGGNGGGNQPTQRPTPQQPRMQIVPDEDKAPATKEESPLSVNDIIKDETKKEPTPGTLGSNSAQNQAKKPIKPIGGSSLPSEFMTNANDPNAG